MSRALVTGATGFVGEGLLELLEDPVILCRDPGTARAKLGEVTAYPWEATAGPPPAEAFEGIDVVYHLAGEPVFGRRWTPAYKERLRASRVDGTRHLVDGMCAAEPRPRVLVALSACGYYGSPGAEIVTEASPHGRDSGGFLTGFCDQWEEEASRARELGVRVVNVRTGIVLEKNGGALKAMLLPFRLGLGGPIGRGQRYFPWIHRRDFVELLLFCAARDDLHGPVNGSAPNPVTNRELTRTLAKVLGRPAFLPVPPLGLRVLFGEVAEEMTASIRMVPKVAQESGFEFRYPELEAALRDILE